MASKHGHAFCIITDQFTKTTTDLYRRRVIASRRINYWLLGAPGAKRTIVGRTLTGASAKHVLVLKKPKGTYVKQGHLGEEWLEFDAKRLAGGTVGYLRFNVFMMPLLGKIRKAVESFATCKAVIIDLRGNPGGVLFAAIDIARRFIAEGVIVSTEGRGTPTYYKAIAEEAWHVGFPLVVLVDKDSAEMAFDAAAHSFSSASRRAASPSATV